MTTARDGFPNWIPGRRGDFRLTTDGLVTFQDMDRRGVTGAPHELSSRAGGILTCRTPFRALLAQCLLRLAVKMADKARESLCQSAHVGVDSPGATNLVVAFKVCVARNIVADGGGFVAANAGTEIDLHAIARNDAPPSCVE